MNKIFAIATVAVALTLVACEKEEETAEVITYATLTVDAVAEGEGGEIALTSAACVRDADTGLFTAEFTGEDGSALSIKIKNFTSSGATYTCAQATDNTAGGIGGKYDGCAVAISLADPETSVNTYAMHRDLETTKDFEYQGDCSIAITYMEPQVQGTIDCSGLVQTELQGAARNPIDSSVTAAIKSGSTFFCDI